MSMIALIKLKMICITIFHYFTLLVSKKVYCIKVIVNRVDNIIVKVLLAYKMAKVGARIIHKKVGGGGDGNARINLFWSKINDTSPIRTCQFGYSHD